MSEAPNPEPAAEAEWWDDPSLPWRHQPTKADIACFSWLGVAGVYGLIMLWLRIALIDLSPETLASLGSWSGMVLVGAGAATGDQWWPLILFLGTFGLVKFDWIYWWAGRLWGRNLIEVWSGRSARARRVNEWAERFARKYDILALIISMIPFVPGRGVVVAVLGEAGTSLRKFLTVSILTSAVVNAALLWLGFQVGKPAKDAMDTYGSYLLWVSGAMLIATIVIVYRQQQGARQRRG